MLSPIKNLTITFKTKSDIYDALERLHWDMRCSRSEVIRQAIEAFVRRHDARVKRQSKPKVPYA